MTTSPFPFFGQNNERTIGDQWSMTQANGMITKLTGKNWFCSITLQIFFLFEILSLFSDHFDFPTEKRFWQYFDNKIPKW